MLNMYQEIIMDHYKNPRNRGKIDNGCCLSAELRNSSCGDEISCSGVIVNNTIDSIYFDGKGCVISQAAASLLSEKVKNNSIDVIMGFDQDDMVALIGISLGPVRMQCALLALTALQQAIQLYQKK